MNTPYFICKIEDDGKIIVSHNLDGRLGFCTEDEISQDTYRLIQLAIHEGKRERSREINALLKDA